MQKKDLSFIAWSFYIFIDFLQLKFSWVHWVKLCCFLLYLKTILFPYPNISFVYKKKQYSRLVSYFIPFNSSMQGSIAVVCGGVCGQHRTESKFGRHAKSILVGASWVSHAKRTAWDCWRSASNLWSSSGESSEVKLRRSILKWKERRNCSEIVLLYPQESV